MTRLYVYFASLLILCLINGCGTPQATRLQPVAVRPVLPEISMKYSFYEANDSLHVFLRFEDEQEVLDVLRTTTAMEYFVKTGLADRDPVLASDSLVKPQRKITDVEGQLQLNFTVPASVIAEPNVLHVRLWQAMVGQERMAVRFRVPLRRQMLEKDFILVGATDQKPVFGEYLNTSDKIFVRHFGSNGEPVKALYYPTNFLPALPPMSMRADEGRLPAATDTLTFYPSDTIRFQKEGLYTFEPQSAYAKSIYVDKGGYPQLTTAQELIQPLIYITTSAERETLFNAPNPKEAIDSFWLKVAGDKATARELIRKYYGRVEKANKLFTCHKAGWTTDRGMIYIIYGRPSNMSQTGNTESWIYRASETSPYIKFVFNKKENTFTENNYELVRLRDYEENWYSTVAKWRAGITDNM